MCVLYLMESDLARMKKGGCVFIRGVQDGAFVGFFSVCVCIYENLHLNTSIDYIS